jgi:hypothetical protein
VLLVIAAVLLALLVGTGLVLGAAWRTWRAVRRLLAAAQRTGERVALIADSLPRVTKPDTALERRMRQDSHH